MERIDDVFAGVEKSFKEYNSVNSGNIFEDLKLHRALSVEVVSGLTDILKNVVSLNLKNLRSPIGFASLLT